MNENMKIKYFDEELEVYDERRVVNKNTYSITLNYVPSPTRTLTVENGKTLLTETTGVPSSNQYVLDRENGLLLFNEAMKGKVMVINYSAIGLWCISADKVYTNVDNKGEIIETLEDLMRENREIIESIKTVGDASAVITQLQADIDSALGLADNIMEGSSVNEELTKTITSSKGANTTLSDTISNADAKINEMNTWVNQHGDIVNLDNRVDTVEIKIPQITEQLDTNQNNIIKSITVDKTVDEIQAMINLGGRFKFAKGEITLTKQLIVKDNTILESNKGTVIKSTVAENPIKVKGNNIKLKDLTINCNNISNCGIYVDKHSFNVDIDNCEVYGIYETTRPAYGIYISTLNCRKIEVKNCYVHDVVSVADGVVGTRLGGWCKGVIVDLYDSFLVGSIGTPSISDISKDIYIHNNTIENIGVDAEDSDGIYIEGYRNNFNTNVNIYKNSIYNCGKRGIKILPSKGVRVDANYIYSNRKITMHSFISCYGNDFEVTNNKGLVEGDSDVIFGIEFGYDKTKYGEVENNNIVISDNTFDIKNSDTCFGILSNEMTGTYNNVNITNNIINGVSMGMYFMNGNTFKFLNINNNTIDSNSFGINVNKTIIDKMVIENNKIIGVNANNDIILNFNDVIKNNITMITDNYLNQSTYIPISLSNCVVATLSDNKIYGKTGNGWIISNVSKIVTYDNIDISTGLSLEDDIESFKTVSISTNTFDLNVTNNAQVSTIKLSLSQATTLNTLTGNQGQIVTILPAGSQGLTIPHNTSIHLKDSVDVTISAMEQSITLVKMDNRWLEIARNF